MSDGTLGASAEISAFVSSYCERTLLRFLLCGSVDDGKSTLIGRLLYESHALYADQLAALQADSQRHGTQGRELDFALLMDGLSAEREQGITIDVAYRYFSTPQRQFIVADTPGHEQYTRNMVTGASTADCAVIVLDARKGSLTQTRRHSWLVSLLGINDLVLAVNKMDLVEFSEQRFAEIEAEYRDFAQRIGLERITCIPVSALRGDNLTVPSEQMPWYRGPTLVQFLEHVEVDRGRGRSAPFRMPVQWVNRAGPDFRGFAGTIASGDIQPGDEIVVLPSGRESKIERVVGCDGDLPIAAAGQAITLTFADEIDTSRGDVVAARAHPPEVADQFEVTVVWMGDEPMLRGRTYVMRTGTKTAMATIAPLKYKLNVDSFEHVAATRLDLNEIGVCEIELAQPIVFEAYSESRKLGAFILIDRITNNTVGAGMIHFALRRSHTISPQALNVDKAARAASLHQTPCVLWLTGLSGSGKSTIANLVETDLHRRGNHTYLLDGDNVRRGLNRDLGFTDAARVENIRRVAEVAKLMIDAGLIVIVAFISPFRSERNMARSLLGEEEFIEVFVDAPLAVAEQRDPKGLYKRARRGELLNFTGIDSPYERPEDPDLRIDTTVLSPSDAAARLIEALEQRGCL